jgi:hypothetical protein
MEGKRVANAMLLFMAVVLVLIAVFHFVTRKYLNPYKLTMIFGKKGSGKSTLLTKLAYQHIKHGWTVYSTVEIAGTYKFDIDDIGKRYIPPNSVLLIDEVGMIWDNRNFKTFKTEHRDYFKLQRHYKHKVILFSQTFDIDKKIRDLTDEMYLVVKRMRVFSYAKRINKQIVLHKSSAESPSRLDEDLVFDPLLLFWMGSRRFTYIPKYISFFNSFDIPDLDEKEYFMWSELPESLRPRTRRSTVKMPKIPNGAPGTVFLADIHR